MINIDDNNLIKIFRILYLFIFSFFILGNIHSTNQQKTKQFQNIKEIILSKEISKIANKSSNIIENNILTQSMLSWGNTRYIIQDEFDLNGKEITIQEGCVLDFQGGVLKNGTIIGKNTQINAGVSQIFSLDVTLHGTWKVSMAYPEWFGATGDGETDDTNAINKCIDIFAGNRTNIFLGRNYAVSNIFVKKACSIIGTPFTKIIHIGEGVCINVSPPEDITSWNQFVRTKIFDLNITLNAKSTVGLRINQCVGSWFERIFITGVNTSVPVIDNSTLPQEFSNIKSRGVLMDGTSSVVTDKNSIFNNILNRVVANKVDIGFDIDGIVSDSKFYNIESNTVGEGLRIRSMHSHNVTIMDCQFVDTNIAINLPATFMNGTITGCNLELYRYYGIYKAKYPNSSVINIVRNGATTTYDTKITDFQLFSLDNSQICNNIVGWGSNKPEEEKTPSEKSNIDGNFNNCLVYGNRPNIGNSIKYPDKAINMNFMFRYGWIDNKDCSVIPGNTNIQHPIVDNIRLINQEHGAVLTLKGDRAISAEIDNGLQAFIPYGGTDMSVVKDAIIGTMIYRTDYDRPIWRNSDFQWKEIDGCKLGTPRKGNKANSPGINHLIYDGFIYYRTDLLKPTFFNKDKGIYTDASGSEVNLPKSGKYNKKPDVSNSIISAGYIYFVLENGIQKPIIWTGTKWVNSMGIDANIKEYGEFELKPKNVPIGFGYFCTNRKTNEGVSNGIMIYHKGNNNWVDALGRVVE